MSKKTPPRKLFLACDVEESSIAIINASILRVLEYDEERRDEMARDGNVYTPKPITLYIDSYGGDVYKALGLIGLMESSTTPINTHVLGSAMSAGLLISICGAKRTCNKYSTYMLHQLSSFAEGALKDIEESVEENKRLQKIIESIIVGKTSVTKQDLLENFKAKQDLYINAKEAFRSGR